MTINRMTKYNITEWLLVEWPNTVLQTGHHMNGLLLLPFPCWKWGKGWSQRPKIPSSFTHPLVTLIPRLHCIHICVTDMSNTESRQSFWSVRRTTECGLAVIRNILLLYVLCSAYGFPVLPLVPALVPLPPLCRRNRLPPWQYWYTCPHSAPRLSAPIYVNTYSL